LDWLVSGGAGVKIFDGFEEIEIFPSRKCPHCAAHLHSFTRLSALFLLQRFKTDEMAMASLRRMVCEGGYDLGSPIPNDEVLERVAARLAAGELHVIRKLPVFGTGAAKPREEGQPQVQAAPLPPPRREAEAPPPPPPEEAVFNPNVDPVAMAQVLAQAAQSGAPFCEE
jgi:hypothetical protein